MGSKKLTIVLTLTVVAMVVVGLGSYITWSYLWFGGKLEPYDADADFRQLNHSLRYASPNNQRSIRLLEQIGAELGEHALGIDLGLDSAGQAALLDDEAGRFLDELLVVSALQIARDQRPFTEVKSNPWGVCRAINRSLLARVEIATRSGDAQSAVAEIERGVKLAQLLLEHPMNLSRLVGNSVMSQLAYRVIDPEMVAALDDDALSRIRDVLNAVQIPPFERTLEGERLIALDVIRSTLPETHVLRSMSAAAQADSVNRLMTAANGWASKPLQQRLDKVAPTLDARDDGNLAGMLMPSIGRAVHADDMMRQMIDATRLILAIDAHRRDTGEFPGSLELLEDRFVDPFAPDGRFVYKQSVEGYQLYSVGYDGIDNGGEPDEDNPRSALSAEGFGSDFLIPQGL